MEAIDSITLAGSVIVEIHDAATGKLKSRDIIRNKVVDAGKRAIADALRGNTAPNLGVITYAAVGTGTNVPTAADVQLQTELTRKQVSIRTVLDETAEFRTFFNEEEANGALKEIGLFGGMADGTPNSGTLFARLNISRTKTSNDTLTLTHGIAVR